MAERATLNELLEFANKVRGAGGGNPLDALMPAVPQDSSQCLIAKNLNFNCKVHNGPAKGNEHIFEGEYPKHIADGDAWFMLVEDKALRDRIAEALDLPRISWHEYSWRSEESTHYAVELPEAIGAVAAEFDKWEEVVVEEVDFDHPKADEYGDVRTIEEGAAPEEIARLMEFWPYIDASTKEAYANATFVNENGEIVL